VRVIHAQVAITGQRNDLDPYPWRGRVGWRTTTVPMGQGNSPFLPVGCQDPPCMALTHPKKLRCLGNCPLPFQYPVQHM
jgi:hypothetical protein